MYFDEADINAKINIEVEDEHLLNVTDAEGREELQDTAGREDQVVRKAARSGTHGYRSASKAGPRLGRGKRSQSTPGHLDKSD